MSSKEQPPHQIPHYDEGYRSIVDERDEQDSRFMRMSRNNPFVPAGILFGLGALGYSIYHFKSKKESTKVSVYIMQSRVAIQGAVIGMITLGVGYSMFKEFMDKKK